MDNNNRQDAIRAKGFNMGTTATTQYGKIKVGVKTLDDAIKKRKANREKNIFNIISNRFFR